MKKLLILVTLITCISFPAFSRSYREKGMSFSLSGFDCFSAGIGYTWSDIYTNSYWFSALNTGFVLEFNTDKELVARMLAHACSGFVFGVSPQFITNFDDYSFGLALEAGLGIPELSITYRYNFYYDKQFNGYQIGLILHLLR